MKRKILQLCLPVLIMLLPVKILSQASPHDSLLFDGNNQNSFYSRSCQCKVKVLSYEGEAYGTRIIKEVETLCGLKDTIEKLVRAQVRLGDELCVGEDEWMQTLEGTLKIQLQNGTVLVLKQNTKISIRANYCVGKGAWITIHNGGFCYDGGKANDENSLKCETKFSMLDILNTLYTVEASDESETVKVYDGQVKVSLLHPDMTEKDELNKKMGQLVQDLQVGKITKDEFQEKIKEYTDKTKYIIEHMNPVKVDTGHKCIITKSSLTLEPADSNDDRWWEKIK